MRECSVKRGEIISRQTKSMNSKTLSQYLIIYFLMALRHEINNLESSVVVQEREFAINRAL